MQQRSGFSAELWHDVEPTFAAILEHPFLTGLVDGTLPIERFRFYVVQDAHYLRAYARALAYAGAHADEPGDTALFTGSAIEAIQVEQEMHRDLLGRFGITTEEVEATPLSPSAQLYVSTMLADAAQGPFSRAVASLLPCFWIYWEVGRALVERGSPDLSYQRWIDTYADEAFGRTVEAVIAVTDRVAAQVGEDERDRMRTLFAQGCRLEWMFWDAAWREERWPIPLGRAAG